MSTLAQASLTGGERRALTRAVEALEAELGEDLLAVWLYGSRARGERLSEDSDIDLMVVVSDSESLRARVRRIVDDTAVREKGNPFVFSSRVTDPRALAEKAAVESLYLREVERDRIVLSGGEITPLADLASHELPPRVAENGVMTRSLVWLDTARRYLASAERALAHELDSGAIASTAYYAVFYSARAALSEEGNVGRKHTGTWHLVRTIFVETGRLDAALVSRAQKMQEYREGADYEARTFTREESEAQVAGARRFVEAIERLIGAEREER